MKRSHIITTGIAFLLLISTTVSAQALSLRDCVNLALMNKETLASARFDVESARKARLGSYSAILPSLRLSGGWNESRDAGSDFTIDPVTGEVIPAGGSRIATYTTWSSGLSLSQNIFDGGAWWSQIAKAKNNFLIARQVERQALINVIADVHRRYFQVLKDIQLLEVASLNLDLALEQVELTRMKYELGAVNKTDLLKAEVLLGQARVGVVNQESIVRTSRNELRNAMGLMAAGTELVLQDIENVILTMPESAEALATMEENNPGLLAVKAQIKSARLDYRIVRGSRLPSLSASLTYGAYSEDLGDLSDRLQNFWQLRSGVSLSFPLFSGFNLSTRTQQAKLELRKQENTYTTTRNDAYVQLEALLEVLNTYQDIIPINEEVLVSAEEDLKLVQERYSLGSATILEVLDAQVSVIRAQADLVSSRYDALTQKAFLKAQLGILDQEFE